MNCIRIVVALSVLGCGVAGLVTADEKAGPEQAFLQNLVGEWDAVVNFGGGESKAVEKSRLEGGVWLISDFHGEFGGQKFVGHGVKGYDTNKKKFAGVWVDTMSASMMTVEGKLDGAGKVLTEVAEAIGMDGKPNKMKMTTEIVDKDTHVFKMYDTPDAAQPSMTITYKRKK